MMKFRKICAVGCALSFLAAAAVCGGMIEKKNENVRMKMYGLKSKPPPNRKCGNTTQKAAV